VLLALATTAMPLADIDERPAKKRRFFADESPNAPRTQPGPSVLDGEVELENGPSEQQVGFDSADPAFDRTTLESILGERLESHDVDTLRRLSGNNVERGKGQTVNDRCTPAKYASAINLYFDGSWKKQAARSTLSQTPGSKDPFKPHKPQRDEVAQQEAPPTPPPPTSPGEQRQILELMPDERYVGAFGVTGWATRSGTNLLKHGERVRIERAKTHVSTKSGRGSKSGVGSKRQDTVVRFTNARGEEVGRLETESTIWIAALMDQDLCTLSGTCVYAPDRLRTNDTIYLQVICSFLKGAFRTGNLIKPENSNRQTGLFEAQETQEERNLHLRQVALVKLFDEIRLEPSKSNATTAKHKRQGLLRAAEVAQQYDQKAAEKPNPSENPASSPPSEDAEEGEELEQDQLDSLYKKAQSFDFDTPEYQPPNTFVMDLRRYQKQALHWMLEKEGDHKSDHRQASMHPLWEEYIWPTKDVDNKPLVEVKGSSKFYVNPYSGELSLDMPVQEQNCLGGILADEMGLGKTIEMLSLIHSQRSEIDLAAMSNGTKTTVNSLPRLSKGSSVIEPAPCTTLVVAPMTLLAQWFSEAGKASKEGTLKVVMYYGADKGAVNLQAMCCEANAANAPNIVITSYGTILSEFNQVAANSGDRSANGGLFSLDYYRVILDEAHYIKNRQSKTAKACYEIQAKHRWVLTGTPIVNRLEDLFSLVHFLRVEPWSNFSFWKTFITVPFESKEYLKALDVVQTVLEPLVLRRTKDMRTPQGEALVPLPPKTIEVEQVELSKNEREVYQHIFARVKRTFNSNVEAGTLMKSYTTIFAQILRLRQSCDHPILIRNKEIVADEEDAAAAADIVNGLGDDMDLQSLIDRFTMDEVEQDANKFGAHALKQIQDEAEAECPICAEEPMLRQTVTGCWHSACLKCLTGYIEHQKDKNELPRCFSCREPINSRDMFEVVRDDEEEQSTTNMEGPRISLKRVNNSSSAKISALLGHLANLRRTNPGAKSVVFSQFTSFLDLIEPYLRSGGIPFLRLDGSMSQKQRVTVLTAFSSSEGKNANKGIVFLLSLRAGGVGLNLTAAQNVFMMDPWWSWAVEAQAIDRVHRMGQEKSVRVIRFVCRDSIEEKMLRIQERKKFM